MSKNLPTPIFITFTGMYHPVICQSQGWKCHLEFSLGILCFTSNMMTS